MSSDHRYTRDEWPAMADGSKWDGRDLMQLYAHGKSPFGSQWDVALLVEEVESALKKSVADIPVVTRGSNCYGFHMVMSDGENIIARLLKADVNMPGYDGYPLEGLISDSMFEAEVYKLLKDHPVILPSILLYSRCPRQRGDRTKHPSDISGRGLSIFRKAVGESIPCSRFEAEDKTAMLTQCAGIRASLFNFFVPPAFIATWFRERVFEQRPDSFPIPAAPTREFCIALFTSKIEATIPNIGDMIGWPSDNVVVGPIAAAAKISLLKFIPYMLPPDDPALYRIVLEHGDFGIHNMTAQGSEITSLFDWETSCLCPAILSNPELAVTVDLNADEDGNATYSRVPKDASGSDLEEYQSWAEHYFETLYYEAPEYHRAIKEGKDARHLSFALRDWRGEDPEGYFGRLGAWAEGRMREMGIN